MRGEAREGAGHARGAARLASGVLLLALLGHMGWTAWELRGEARESVAARRVGMQDALELSRTLHAASSARHAGRLERLAVELRAQDLWTDPDLASDGRLAVGGEGEPTETSRRARRLRSVLRRSLEGWNRALAIELVVAGHDGLWSVRLERDAALPARAMRTPEGHAKALWYADEVQRAVGAQGRRVAWGPIGWEPSDGSDPPVASSRAALALHQGGGLIQGAVLVTLDENARTAGIASHGGDVTLSLWTPDGRPIGGAGGTPGAANDPSIAEAIAAVVAGERGPDAIGSDDSRWRNGLALAASETEVASVVVLAETEPPPHGLARWWASGRPVGLGLLAVAVLAALRASTRPAEPQTVHYELIQEPAHDPEIEPAEIVRSSFALRDWLSDVRGCLERDAATRGLGLDLRCAASLPPDLESDPGWLGGLLVAMGREALDATPDSRIRLDVREDEDADTIRFEVDAGGIPLSPVRGMPDVAERLGVRFETSGGRGIALIVPQA